MAVMVMMVAITAGMAIITGALPYIWDGAVVAARVAGDILADAAPAGVADMAVPGAVPVAGAVDVAPAGDPVVVATVDPAAGAVTVVVAVVTAAAVDTDLMAGSRRGQPFSSMLSRT